MGGRKSRAAKAGLTSEDDKRKEALEDLRESVKLLGRSIDGVLDGLPDCHVGLIEHGKALMLSRGAAGSPTPTFSQLRKKAKMWTAGVDARTEPGGSAAASVDRGAMKTEPPSAKSDKPGAPRGVGRGAPRREPAGAASTASPSWPPPSESSWLAATDDASSELSEGETSAQTSSPSSLSARSPSPAAAGRSTTRPSSIRPPPPPPPPTPPQQQTSSAFNVFLEWYAAAPETVAGRAVESLPTPPGLRDSAYLDVPSFFQVWDENSDKGAGAARGAGETAAARAARRVDLVIWHLTSRTLELPVDENLTAANVADALGRELVLNFAMVTLLEAANDQRYRRRSSDSDDGANPAGDDPDVVEFFARFEANVQALMEEARSAPAACSEPPPNFSQPVEDGLRTALASVRRRHSTPEEIHRSSIKENLAAADAAADAAAKPGAMPHPSPDELRHHGTPFAADDAPRTAPPSLVLRPMKDLFRVFSEVELMEAFEKTIGGEMPRGCYEMWFERKRIVRTGVDFRHEYVMKTGHWYGG